MRTLDFSDKVKPDPPATLVQGNAHQVVFVCDLAQGSQPSRPRVATFAPNKHLALNDPGSERVTACQASGGLAIDVSARSLARFVELGI